MLGGILSRWTRRGRERGGKEEETPVQTRLAVSSLQHCCRHSVQKDRDALAGTSPALLLLPTCTLTYIRWNRVRRPGHSHRDPLPWRTLPRDDERSSLSSVSPSIHACRWRFPNDCNTFQIRVPTRSLSLHPLPDILPVKVFIISFPSSLIDFGDVTARFEHANNQEKPSVTFDHFFDEQLAPARIQRLSLAILFPFNVGTSISEISPNNAHNNNVKKLCRVCGSVVPRSYLFFRNVKSMAKHERVNIKNAHVNCMLQHIIVL